MDSHLVDINVKYHQKYHYGCLLLAAGDPSYSLIMGQHAESAGRGLRNWLMKRQHKHKAVYFISMKVKS
jgi:hypothetical protein